MVNCTSVLLTTLEQGYLPTTVAKLRRQNIDVRSILFTSKPAKISTKLYLEKSILKLASVEGI